MKLRPGRPRGFSLVEVVLSLGIVAFSVCAMLAVFPIGLKAGRTGAAETRGAHLAGSIFATLRTPPFDGVDCYGARLDLSALDDADPPALLYAGFPLSGPPEIGPARDAGSGYRVELRFHKIPAASAANAAIANRVTLTVSPLGASQGEGSLRFQSIVGNTGG